MTRIFTLIVAVVIVMAVRAASFSYRFSSTSLPEAIQKMTEEHPELDINFIYNELENYRTSAIVDADDPYSALRQLVGLNPVTVTKSKDTYYVEALQHGRYVYTGQVVGNDDEPVVAATVLLLTPKDSTVLTYGITDDAGHFKILCDRQGILAKLSCVGYKTTYRKFDSFNVGTVLMAGLPIELKTVTVEGQTASLLPDRSIYRPTQRQKSASQNALDLLTQMAIPQLQVNPVSEAVTDNAGIEVSLFINSLPASNAELDGLRTLDVKRIEYLENPTDPRFRGAQRVINFIVQEYEYGGYTKITAKENILTGLSSRANIFSKFSYRKMTYDLFVAANNSDSRHSGFSTEGVYSIKDGEATYVTLTRKEITEKSKSKHNQYPITFRATYNSEKIQISNTVGYDHVADPAQNQSGSLTYSPGITDNYTFNRRNSSRSNSLNYQGNFYFLMPNNFSVNATPKIIYTHFNNRLAYSASSTEPIDREANENAINYRLDAYLNKSVSKSHTLMLGLNGGTHINRLRYSGNAVYSDRFHNTFISGLLCYRLQMSKMNIYADGGFCWEQSDINGIKNTDSYPFVHINMRYAPDTKNTFAAYLQYANNTPGIDMKASDLLRENEFMYITGNPLLDNSRHVTFNLSYSWFPSNRFKMSAYSNFFELFDRQITVYEPYNDGRALLRTYGNEGNYMQNEIGISANLKLFGGKLLLYANPRQCFNRSTGVYDKHYNPFHFSAQAVFYLRQFYFQAFYQTAQKMMFSDSPTIYRSRDYYYVTVGWSKSDLNIRLTAYNMFNSHWDRSDLYVDSPLYKEHKVNFGTSYHARINLSVTYTFGYGKKVQRGNEVEGQSGASSAILK